MIAYLKGSIKDVFENFVIFNINDEIGYKIEGLPLEAKIIGKEMEIFVYTHYTQQDTRMFGFLNRKSYLLFHDLLNVSGVGPKSAVSLLNNVGVDYIKLAVIEREHKTLMGNGIGQKIAQKIVIELDGKYDRKDLEITSSADGLSSDKINEVTMALEGLGYNRREISEAEKLLDKDIYNEPFEKIFRKTLNLLQKKVNK
jgi:Holliday junction DNA helicase RuvA